MPSLSFPRVFAALALLGGLAIASPAFSQVPGEKGFQVTAQVAAKGEEISSQPHLWVLEVDFKPMRMQWIEITDPKTGEKKKELVWYLIYRAVNRPIQNFQDEGDTTPVNAEDDRLSPPMFAPEFTLVSEIGNVQKIYSDAILPEAQAKINRREKYTYQNPVEIVQPVPSPTTEDPNRENALYGIAMWKGIDPDTDYFKVYLEGFSNGYRVAQGPDENPLMLRKTLVLNFWRPGDRFEENEREIRFQGDPKWIYRPEQADTEATAENQKSQESDQDNSTEK